MSARPALASVSPSNFSRPALEVVSHARNSAWPPLGGDLLQARPGLLGVATGQDDVGAGFGEGPGDRAAQFPGAADDHGDFAMQRKQFRRSFHRQRVCAISRPNAIRKSDTARCRKKNLTSLVGRRCGAAQRLPGRAAAPPHQKNEGS